MKKIDNQIPPLGDNRKRTNKSVRLYLAELFCGPGGCTLRFGKSIERIIYLSIIGGKTREEVVYDKIFYKLESAEQMKKTVAFYRGNGVSVQIPVYVDSSHVKYKSFDGLSLNQDFDAFPFIDITKNEELRSYESIKKFLNNPNYFFNDETFEWELVKNN